MNPIQRRALELLAQKRRELEARVPRLKRSMSAQRPAASQPLSTKRYVILGSDERNLPVRIDEHTRLEHTHAVGTTGSGKTNLTEHMVRQDILNGRGVCVPDLHGGHPGSLYRNLVTWLGQSGLAKSRTVHLIDPNAGRHVTGFNPLAVPEGHDPAVVAEAVLEAFERLWGDEDPDSKPTIQRVLSGTFTALAELGLTLAEARLLFDPEDVDGIREYIHAEVRDEYAREELGWLQMMGSDRPGQRDLRAEVTGPRNRIAKLVRLEALRTMVGQTERVIDFRQAMDEGHIILANLSGGAHTYEKGGDILGRLLVRSLLFHAKRRQQPHVPFFVYLDECQRCLSGDVPTLLAEARKYGVGLMLAHQWQSQLSAVDEEILSAVRSGTNIKMAFRIKDHKEAMDLAEMIMPLNLERPVDVLTKETVVGYGVRRMQNASAGASSTHTRSTGKTESSSTGVTNTEGVSEGTSTTRTENEQKSFATSSGWSSSEATGENETHGLSTSHVDSESDSDSEGSSTSHGSNRARGGGTTEQYGTSRGERFGQSFDVDVNPWRTGEQSYRRAAGWGEANGRDVTAGYDSGRNHAIGNSQSWSESENDAQAQSSQHNHSSGVANGTVQSESRGTSRTVTDTESGSTTHGITHGIAIAKGVTETRSSSTARLRQEGTASTVGDSIGQGTSHSTGWSEALVPIMAMRPGSVHSKDNVLYHAAQTLRSLMSGTAFINFVDHTGMNSALVRVPLRTMKTLSDEAFEELVAAIAERSPSAQPIAQAKDVVRARKLRLTKAAHQRRLPPPEPTKPGEFRVIVRNDQPQGDDHD